jgi:hypothetical protein
MTLTQYAQLNDQEVKVYEFMVENRQVPVTHLSSKFTQYGARIKSIKEKVGCICRCGGQNENCPAEEHFFSIITYKNKQKYSTWYHKEVQVSDYKPEMSFEDRGKWLKGVPRQPVKTEIDRKRARFFALGSELKIDPIELKERAKHPKKFDWNVEHFNELTIEQLDLLIKMLEVEKIDREEKEHLRHLAQQNY